MFLDNLEELIHTDHVNAGTVSDSGLDELIEGKCAEVDGVNIAKNLFSLKEIKECESEANI